MKKKMNVKWTKMSLILTESKNRVFALKHLPPLGGINHGHHIIEFKYSLESYNNNNKFKKEKFVYKSVKFEEMREYFKNIN